MDRFMLKTVVSYPTKEDEQRIMRRNTRPEGSKAIRPVVSLDDIRRGREAAKEVYMDEKIEHYILDIVFATRFPEEYKLDKLKPLIAYGASPRGSINLVTASKVYAFLRGRPTSFRKTCGPSLRTSFATASGLPTRPKPKTYAPKRSSTPS